MGEEDRVLLFRLDGRRWYARWHEGLKAEDAVMRDAAGRWAFSEPSALLASWSGWDPEVPEPDCFDADCEPVQDWLSGSRLGVPCSDLLAAWNLAGDVARGVNVPWNDRSSLFDRVYDKLFWADMSVPLGEGEWLPRWSARERRALLQVAQAGFRLIRLAVGHQPAPRHR